MNSDDVGYTFEGFDSPRYTQVPDQLFDELLPRLSGAELKVLLYIIRRTFGFKKDFDNISLKQMVEGIQTRDGRVLDGGTGLSKAGVARAVKSLVEKQVVVTVRNQSSKKGDEPTTYALRFRNGRPVSTNETRGVVRMRHGGVSEVDTQETVEQQTEIQQSNLRMVAPEQKHEPERVGSVLAHRSPTTNSEPSASDREIITAYMESMARDLRDQAPLRSTVTRLLRLYRRSQLENIEAFIGVLYQARSIVREHTSSIKAGEPGARNLTPYFLAVVEDMLGLRDDKPPDSSTLKRTG